LAWFAAPPANAWWEEEPPRDPYAAARQQCGPSFRLDEGNGPLASTTPHLQGPVENCFAHTAAILYDAWGLSHAPPLGYYNRNHRASPYWANFVPPGQNSTIIGALGWMYKNGSCDEWAFSRRVDDNTEARLPPWQYEELFNKHYPQFEAIWQYAQGRSEDAIWLLADVFTNKVGDYLFPPENLPDRETVVAALKAPTINDAIFTLYQPLCNNSGMHEKLAMPRPYQLNFNSKSSNPRAMIDSIWTDEGANRQPFGLGVCSSAFQDPYIKIPRGRIKGDDDRSWMGCEGHAVALIGRRWNEQKHQCEYLFRNSWEPTCAHYNPAAGLTCEESTAEVWASSEWIDRAVYAIVHIPEASSGD
jgi:hypothetical protein